jgi:hypothetical protein
MNPEKFESGQEESKTLLVNELASLLHETWRSQRKDEATGIFTPRIKTTTDKEWIEAHGGLAEVDIANTPYLELPSDWQRENKIAAEIAMEKLEDVMYIIHERWLDRNFDHATPEQKLNYSRLPVEDKKKDLDILEEAVQVFAKHLK